MDGAELRKRFDERGVQYGPAFTGLAAVHIARETRRHRAGRGRAARPDPLATSGLRRASRPAGRLFPVRCGSSGGPGRWAKVLLGLPLGIRRLRSYGRCPQRPLLLHAGDQSRYVRVEADLDVLDEHGAVLLTVQGLRLGTGASESGNHDRVLDERLLTIEWQQRELPELRPHRRRNLAADQHCRHRGRGGDAG